MGKHYSKSAAGFFDDDLHEVMPADAVVITDAVYSALLADQAQGLIIQAGADGVPVAVEPPPPTLAQLVAALTTAVKAFIDAAAQALGYDNILSAISYADDATVPAYQSQGQSLRAWRANVWKDATATLNAVSAGTTPAPTAAALILTLPVFVAPTV